MSMSTLGHSRTVLGGLVGSLKAWTMSPRQAGVLSLMSTTVVIRTLTVAMPSVTYPVGIGIVSTKSPLDMGRTSLLPANATGTPSSNNRVSVAVQGGGIWTDQRSVPLVSGSVRPYDGGSAVKVVSV